MKVPATIISSIAILGSITWLYYEPGFEPAITTLLGISGLLWSLSQSKSSNSNNESVVSSMHLKHAGMRKRQSSHHLLMMVDCY